MEPSSDFIGFAEILHGTNVRLLSNADRDVSGEKQSRKGESDHP
jgi:hypothetical protein